MIVPGLWMPSPLMWLLAARLEAAGYAARVFSYSGRGPHEANVESLARFAREGGAFVGHSLGGVLVLETLNRHPDIAVASALLIGSPVRGSFVGRRFGRTRFGRWMLGQSVSCWEERNARWSRSAPLGVLAGSVAIGLGRMTGGRLPGVNDGVVRVEETAVEGVAASKVVPQPHSWMPVSRGVARMTETFLRTGSFG